MAYLSVDGRVNRVFFDSKAVEVAESFTAKSGEVFERKFTFWFERPVDLVEGQFGRFSGVVSFKVRDWVNRETGQPVLDREGKPGRSVDVSVNNAKFEPGELPVVESVVVPDSWASVVDDGLPF